MGTIYKTCMTFLSSDYTLLSYLCDGGGHRPWSCVPLSLFQPRDIKAPRKEQEGTSDYSIKSRSPLRLSVTVPGVIRDNKQKEHWGRKPHTFKDLS